MFLLKVFSPIMFITVLISVLDVEEFQYLFNKENVDFINSNKHCVKTLHSSGFYCREGCL
jgi:hypothetical protein